mmetsp:Transcript_17553/g.28413  ORF Transcript_17553/g.28413 Transcript_17553/m.28413 type:complete len:394 (-) Transcript_17553:10-1191(-)
MAGLNGLMASLPDEVWRAVNEFVGDKSVDGWGFVRMMVMDVPVTNVKVGRVNTMPLGILKPVVNRHVWLRSISFAYSALDFQQINAIAAMIEDNTSLVRLSLQACRLADVDMCVLSGAIRKNKSLTYVDFSQNEVGSFAFAQICIMMKENKVLETVVANCLLSPPNTVLEPSYIGDVLGGDCTLKSLDWDNGEFGPKMGLMIGRALAVNISLVQLNLSFNELSCEGGCAMGMMLQTNRTLKRLDLSNCGLTNTCGCSIAKGLEQNSSLLKLNLGYNRIGQRGGEELGHALQSSCLDDLNLVGNGLGQVGGAAIALALVTNKYLRVLKLCMNSFGREVGPAIGEALKANSTLQVITLARNNLCIQGARPIGKALENNQTIKVVDLSANNIAKEK